MNLPHAHLSLRDPLPHRLAGDIIGLPTRRQQLRTLLGAASLLLPGGLAVRALGRMGAHRAQHHLERRWARAVFRFLDVRLTLRGLEHIDPSQSYIVVPLHEGFADVPALLHLPLSMRFVARDELWRWRWLGPLLRDGRHLVVAPERGVWSFRPLLRAARDALDGGESIVLFPQGSILGIETDYHPGAFGLARALGRPLLPIALTGSHRVWEHPFSPRLRYGQQVGIAVLPPISAAAVQARPAEELRRMVQRETKRVALGGQLPAPRHFVPARDGFWDGYAYAIDPEFAGLAAEVAAHRAAVASTRAQAA